MESRNQSAIVRLRQGTRLWTLIWCQLIVQIGAQNVKSRGRSGPAANVTRWPVRSNVSRD